MGSARGAARGRARESGSCSTGKAWEEIRHLTDELVIQAADKNKVPLRGVYGSEGEMCPSPVQHVVIYVHEHECGIRHDATQLAAEEGAVVLLSCIMHICIKGLNHLRHRINERQ